MDRPYCPRCGRPVEVAQQVCGSCGAALTPSSGTSSVPSATSGVYPTVPMSPQAQTTPRAPASYPAQPWTGYTYPQAPGYPAYPQGSPAAYGAYGYPAYAYGYTSPYAYQPYYYPVVVAPRRAPGETLAIVVSWIVTVASGLSILCGLLMSLLLLLAVVAQMDSLGAMAVFAAFSIAPIVGGAYGMYFGIRGIMRKPSPRFSLPHPLVFLSLTALALGTGLLVWNESVTPGPALAIVPLALLCGVLPAFTILAYTAWRLHLPSTRRHVWMSLFYGATLAPLLAIIFELLATIVIAVIVAALGGNASSALIDPTNTSPTNPAEVLILLLSISVVAPIVEEGVKPLGAVLIMRRLRTPASAFLMGMAAGIGFDMFETVGYIGSAEADWIGVALERIGAGLLHGVGAGMAALGWYYLINGKGVRLRWLRGFGGILYAMAQHAIFNGSNLLGLLPGPFGKWMQQPIFLGKLPLDGGTLLFFVYYALIFGLLVYVTDRLVRIPPVDATSRPPTVGPVNDGVAAGGTATVGSAQ